MRNPWVILFLAIFIVFLCGVNLAIGAALAIIFNVRASTEIGLDAVLIALSVAFIGVTILGSYFYNVVTRTLYTLLAMWMGTVAYLFFAAFLFFLVSDIESFIRVPLFSQMAGLIFFAIALLVSVYGILHGRRITVARHKVALRNLPAAWKDKKAVWISDVHLGQLHGPAFARRVVDAVQALAPDIVFIGGDLYDGTSAPDPSDLARPFASLSASWGVLYVTGNHEEFGDNSNFLKAVQSLGMRVLMDEVVTVEGLQVVGVDYHRANTPDGFKTILDTLQLDRSMPSILLKHVPNNLHIAEKAGISLQISGHTHRGQQWPFGYLANRIYKGFGYGLKNHGVLQVLVSSGVGSWGPPLRVGTNAEVVEITFV